MSDGKLAEQVSRPEISDSHKDLIESLDVNPEKTFRELEARGYRIPGRKHPDDY